MKLFILGLVLMGGCAVGSQHYVYPPGTFVPKEGRADYTKEEITAIKAKFLVEEVITKGYGNINTTYSDGKTSQDKKEALSMPTSIGAVK